MKTAFNIIMLLSLILITRAFADSPTGNYFKGFDRHCPGVPLAESTATKCNLITFAKAEEELEAIYNNLQTKADREQKKYLTASHNAWLELRKSQCNLVKTYYTGVAYNKWTSSCKAEMTINRIRELKQLGTGISWVKLNEQTMQ